jgi:hypothetical protein
MHHISSSSINLNPGAYILRHPGNGLAPLALARSPSAVNNDGKLQTIATAGDLGMLLRDASDCVMLLVSGGPVELLVSACLERPDSPMPTVSRWKQWRPRRLHLPCRLRPSRSPRRSRRARSPLVHTAFP